MKKEIRIPRRKKKVSVFSWIQREVKMMRSNESVLSSISCKISKTSRLNSTNFEADVVLTVLTVSCFFPPSKEERLLGVFLLLNQRHKDSLPSFTGRQQYSLYFSLSLSSLFTVILTEEGSQCQSRYESVREGRRRLDGTGLDGTGMQMLPLDSIVLHNHDDVVINFLRRTSERSSSNAHL